MDIVPKKQHRKDVLDSYLRLDQQDGKAVFYYVDELVFSIIVAVYIHVLGIFPLVNNLWNDYTLGTNFSVDFASISTENNRLFSTIAQYSTITLLVAIFSIFWLGGIGYLLELHLKKYMRLEIHHDFVYEKIGERIRLKIATEEIINIKRVSKLFGFVTVVRFTLRNGDTYDTWFKMPTHENLKLLSSIIFDGKALQQNREAVMLLKESVRTYELKYEHKYTRLFDEEQVKKMIVFFVIVLFFDEYWWLTAMASVFVAYNFLQQMYYYYLDVTHKRLIVRPNVIKVNSIAWEYFTMRKIKKNEIDTIALLMDNELYQITVVTKEGYLYRLPIWFIDKLVAKNKLLAIKTMLGMNGDSDVLT